MATVFCKDCKFCGGSMKTPPAAWMCENPDLAASPMLHNDPQYLVSGESAHYFCTVARLKNSPSGCGPEGLLFVPK